MGPSHRTFTWRSPTSQSRLNRFLCLTELITLSSLAEVPSLPRPLFDQTPIFWLTQVGSDRSTYFKMDWSWLCDGGLKRDIAEWWHSHLNFGSASDRLINKLKDFHHYLFNLRRQIQTARTWIWDISLARVQTLDAMEDQRPFAVEETKEQKTSQDEVAEVDLRIEMD